MRIETAREIKNQLRDEVLAWRAEHPEPAALAAAAVGVCPGGDGSYGVAVRHSGASPLAELVVTRGRELAGDACDVREVGVVRPQQWDPGELQSRVRPLRPGLSVAHVNVTAGTIGAFVVPTDDDESTHILSNNHVLADSDRGMPGDAILQPGPADGGQPQDDQVGVLARVAPLRGDTSNLIDAATGVLDDGIEFETAYPAGSLSGWADVDVDVEVEKVGRTTGITRGRVSAIELDEVVVQYPIGSVTFDGQIEVTGASGSFSAGGDSGSVVYDPDTREALGLLFAGSERGGPDGSGLTYCNPFGAVLDELGVRLVEGQQDEARAAKDELATLLRGDPRVNGVGMTRWHGRYAVRVNVVDQANAPDLPQHVHGVEVRVVAVGRITPQ